MNSYKFMLNIKMKGVPYVDHFTKLNDCQRTETKFYLPKS